MGDSISTAQRMRYASGYLELGMANEAEKELACIGLADHARHDVIAAWIDLYLAGERWSSAASLALALIGCHPEEPKGWISRAFAVRRLTGLPAAEAILLEAEGKIGATCALLHYNLACYRCVLGDLDGAWQRLAKALHMDPRWKHAALRDPDLESLHGRIRALP